MKSGENEKAKKCLIRAGKIDVSNTTTLRYMRELEAPAAASKDAEGNQESEQNVTSSIMPISSYKEDKPNIMVFVNLVIGIIIGVAVTAILVVPSLANNKTAADNSQYADYAAGLALQQEKDATINKLTDQNNELKKQKDDLQKQIDGFQVPEDKTALYDPLFNAAEKYMEELGKPQKDRDYSAIADILATIDEKQYETTASKNLLSMLRDEIYPIVSKDHYDIGHSLYNSGKYEEALVELEKAMTFDPTDVDAIYFRARAYHRMGDLENASVYYNIVIKDYPDSNRAKTAKDFLNQIQK
jgi:TolA-binding protein